MAAGHGGMLAKRAWCACAACGSDITVTDGPFTESKEIVGGFALLKANSKEEAIELARMFLRHVGDGECEIRQLYEEPASQAHSAAS